MKRYPLPPFQCQDWEKLKLVMEAFPLATIVSTGEQDWPLVTCIPLFLDDKDLVGHFDTNNPQVEALQKNPKVTCLFRGPDSYVTPSIYPETHYPGWNYISVRVRAEAKKVDDIEETRATLFRLAELHEPEDSGYELKASQKNFGLYSQHITAFRFSIMEAEGVLKLAQDKGPENAERARVYLERESGGRYGDLLKRLLEGG